jgi:hypothetical protein
MTILTFRSSPRNIAKIKNEHRKRSKKRKMEGEVNKFIKVWLSVFVCLSYRYAIGKIVPRGRRRLLCVLPIVCFFLYLPLNLHSVHLGVITSFFIAWLAHFKLLLFALGKGPLSSDPSTSLGRFMAVVCFPIKLRQTRNSTPNETDHSPPPRSP